MDFLEYPDISAEIKGCMTPGKLKMTNQHIVFKNSKTGKVEQINSSEFDVVNFQILAGNWGLRIFLKNGLLYRFVGFKESEKDKIAKFFKTCYKINVLEKELSMRGWNWGTAKFNGSVLSFDVADKTAFEIPLNYVSQCLAGKNEIAMEFHQNDDAPVSLLEMRFFIPSSEVAGDVDLVDAFHQRVMAKASVISVSGDAIAIFREIYCLTPRGRYDIKIFQTFFQLHGKTFDYKIPRSTVLRLFLLPHKDNRQMFFVLSLDPPIKQGQTRYHFLVLLFNKEEETSLELPFTEEELKEKYGDRMQKELTGPTFEVLGTIMKHVLERKLTIPKDFKGHSGTPAISCSFKAAAGLLYPLEKGFIYVHKPPVHIRFEEIISVNFARGGGSTRSFDFEVELKSGTLYTFSSIEKKEYPKLFDFIISKKLKIKNRAKNDKALYKDEFRDSDDDVDELDAYLERVKAEGQERDDINHGNQTDEESTDDDFNPADREESDVSNDFDSSLDEGAESPKIRDKENVKTNQKEKSNIGDKPKKKREKKEKDPKKPKRPATAFMLWLKDNREKIKNENSGIKVTEIAKKGGEMWRDLKDKSYWELKAKKDKERYDKEMTEYKITNKGKDEKSTTKAERKIDESKIKSKEFIDETDSSSENEMEKKTKDNKTNIEQSDAIDTNKIDNDEGKRNKRKKETVDEDKKKLMKKQLNSDNKIETSPMPSTSDIK